MSIEAMKQALEALKTAQNNLAPSKGSAHSFGDGELWDFYEDAATSLRLAIATEESSNAANAAATQEPVECAACNGSGFVVRDPDIGTDQECFVCGGSGVDKDAHPQPKEEQETKRELTDAEIYKVIDQTENAVGYAHNAWDMADQIELVRAILKSVHEIINNYPEKDNS